MFLHKFCALHIVAIEPVKPGYLNALKPGFTGLENGRVTWVFGYQGCIPWSRWCDYSSQSIQSTITIDPHEMPLDSIDSLDFWPAYRLGSPEVDLFDLGVVWDGAAGMVNGRPASRCDISTGNCSMVVELYY